MAQSKILVFGSRYAAKQYVNRKDDPSKYVVVRNMDSIRGVNVENIVKLEGWKNCYDEPKELMAEAEYRAEQFANNFRENE